MLTVVAIVSVTGPASSIGAPERKAVDLFDRTWSGRTDLPLRQRVIY